MALLFMDGFDAGDHNIKGYTGLWYGSGNSSPTTRFNTGRWVSCSSSTNMRLLSSAVSQIFFGVAMATNVTTGSNKPYFSLYGDSGVTQHLTVTYNSTTINLYRGGVAGTLLGSFAKTFIGNVFYYVEISATIATSGGAVTVKVDGQTVITFTGNTKNGGTNTTIDGVLFGSYNDNFTYTFFDDVYICDATGSAPYNTFLGDVRVQTLVPNAAGSSTQFTPSAGANYTTVDELPYSATDYVSDGTSGHRDTYNFTDLSNVGTVYGVQNNVIAKKTDAGSLSIKSAVKSGASVYYGSNTVLSGGDTTITDLRTTDPNTSSAWTQSGVNALEAGFEVV